MSTNKDYYEISIENVNLHFVMKSKEDINNGYLLSNWRYKWDRPLHTHVYNEIIFCDRGNGKLIFENRELNIKQNTITIIPAHCKHVFIPDQHAHSNGFGIYFEKIQEARARNDLFSIMNRSFAQNGIINIDGKDLYDCFTELIELRDHNDPISDGLILTVFVKIIYKILAAYLSELNDTDINTSDMQKKQLPLYNNSLILRHQINEDLNHNYTKDITPISLSKKLFISPKQINRYIFIQYGQTFMQRRTALRIESAEKLLKRSNLTIAEISERVGYNSINTFYSAFKHICKMTPNQYRSIHRGQNLNL